MTKRQKHLCSPPVNKCCGSQTLHAAEPRGTIWECGCGKLWRVGLDLQFGPAWFRAGPIARRRHRRQTAEAPAREDLERSPSVDLAEEALGRLAGNGPHAAALYQSYMEGKERREREVLPGRDEAERLEPSSLHAHEITPDDAALIRMMAGAQFGDSATVVLPSGKTITGAEMRRWLNN